MTRFGPKVGQIGSKWDKSGKFSDQIQYILARLYNVQICDKAISDHFVITCNMDIERQKLHGVKF